MSQTASLAGQSNEDDLRQLLQSLKGDLSNDEIDEQSIPKLLGKLNDAEKARRLYHVTFAMLKAEIRPPMDWRLALTLSSAILMACSIVWKRPLRHHSQRLSVKARQMSLALSRKQI